MSKVLVDRELLERMIQLDSLGLCAQQEYAALRAILAQPAEAEGVAVVGYAVTWIRAGDTPEETVFMSTADFEATGGPRFYSYREPLILQSAHLAALSAVTAERDKIKADRKACWEEFKSLVKSSIEKESYLQDEIGQLTAERDRLREEMAELWKRIDKFQTQSHGITALAEIERLRAEVETLRALLSKSLPVVEAHAGASHMLEGFRPIRNKWDELVDGIRAAMAAKEA